MDHITARGNVDAFLVSSDGRREKVVSGHNTLSYVCADTVARLFAGLLDSRPKTVAFVYAGDASQGGSFIFTEGDRDKTQSDIVTGSLKVHDIAIAPNAQFTSSDDTKYVGNTVTFSAMTTDNTALEYIYGVILKDGDGADAKVLAVKRMGTTSAPIKRPAGYAMSVSWGVTFS